MGNAFMIGTRRDPLEYGRGQVVTLSGELDAVEACAVGAALAAAAASNPRVVVDLTGLEFIDCCALGMLARVRAQARGRTVTCCWPRPARSCGVFSIWPR
jgi:anti-anti-sigma factor